MNRARKITSTAIGGFYLNSALLSWSWVWEERKNVLNTPNGKICISPKHTKMLTDKIDITASEHKELTNASAQNTQKKKSYT